MEEVSAREAEESLKSCRFNTGAGKGRTPIRPRWPTAAKGGSVGEALLDLSAELPRKLLFGVISPSAIDTFTTIKSHQRDYLLR